MRPARQPLHGLRVYLLAPCEGRRCVTGTHNIQLYYILAKYPSVGRVSAMVLCCHVQSHKNRPVCWYASWNFAHSSTVFRSLNELIPLTSSVEVAGSSTLPAHKNTYELEHRNCVIKMFFQHQSVTHLP